MRTGKRTIQQGNEYNHLFTSAKGQFVDVKKYASLSDTVGLIKEVIQKTLSDTKALAAHLKTTSTLETCRNVWNFCFRYIQYEKDQTNIEQVRRPARVWRDRQRGVDCDCLTVFIGSVLTNLGIPFVIRITRYSEDRDFEHVYPVAQIGNKTIILDAVVHRFNYEVPYYQKKDITMNLQYLNGFEDQDDYKAQNRTDSFDPVEIPEDAEGLLLFDENDLQGLEGKAQREARKQKRQERRADKPPLKDRLKKGLNVINKVNPVTALLRAGILASMKLNVGKVAGKLRYSYWNESLATANNMDLNKYRQLYAVRRKLEGIFFGAGGKVENLKKAILEGKGNRDRQVALNGLGAIISPVTDYQELKTIIGEDTYFDEFDQLQPTPSINGLGEPVSATAAVTAASGVIATLMAMLKKIGPLFKKGSKQEQQEILADNTADQQEKTRKFSIKNIAENFRKLSKESPEIADKIAPVQPDDTQTEELTDSDQQTDQAADSTERTSAEIPDSLAPLVPEIAPITPTVAPLNPTIAPPSAEIVNYEERKNTNPTPEKSGFGQWITDHPYATAGIVLAGAGLVYLSYQAWQKKKQENNKNLSGVPDTQKTGKKSKAAPVTIKKVKLL